MARITQYPEEVSPSANDVVLIDGVNGSRKVKVQNLPNHARRDLLWTNPNGSASYSASSINWSDIDVDDITQYDTIEIEFYVNSSSTSPKKIQQFGQIISSQYTNNDTTSVSDFFNLDGNYAYNIGRAIKLDCNRIYFFDCYVMTCYTNGNPNRITISNDRMIPYRIYGIKYNSQN